MIFRILPLIALLLVPFAHADEKTDSREAKKQEHFLRIKEIKLQAIREKIAILQDSASCLQSVKTMEAMRPCDERERNAMQDHQQRTMERWETLRQ